MISGTVCPRGWDIVEATQLPQYPSHAKITYMQK